MKKKKNRSIKDTHRPVFKFCSYVISCHPLNMVDSRINFIIALTVNQENISLEREVKALFEFCFFHTTTNMMRNSE